MDHQPKERPPVTMNELWISSSEMARKLGQSKFHLKHAQE